LKLEALLAIKAFVDIISNFKFIFSSTRNSISHGKTTQSKIEFTTIAVLIFVAGTPLMAGSGINPIKHETL
jgi:hypothetical protein